MFGRTSRRWARARIADARQASPLPDSPGTPVNELLVWLIRLCGAADRGPSAGHLCTGAASVLRRVLSRPQPPAASASEGASVTRQAWRGGPRVRPPGRRLAPPTGSVTMRRVRPALSMTRRWPRTGSACRPATRCRNAGSPRCSGAPPAAGRGPESLMHGRHRRSQTRRASQSRLTRKQGPPAVSPERELTAPGRPGIGGLAVSHKRALREHGCHEGKRSGLAGHPRRGLRGRSGSSARPWTWKLPSMRGTRRSTCRTTRTAGHGPPLASLRPGPAITAPHHQPSAGGALRSYPGGYRSQAPASEKADCP